MASDLVSAQDRSGRRRTKGYIWPNPIGRIIFSPEHHVVVLYQEQADDLRPASLKQPRSLTAYTGKFRLEGDKFITQVDGAWNEFYTGSEQVRYFELTGDKLSIRTPEQPSGS